MAIEDGWVLAEHAARQAARHIGHSSGIDWDAALAAYEAVRSGAEPADAPHYAMPSH